MKLLNFFVQEDFGREYFLGILKYKDWYLSQFSIEFSDYGMSFPALYISLGLGELFSVSLRLLNFNIRICLIGRSIHLELNYDD